MSYTPPTPILEKYANLLINYALGGGRGVQSGEVVLLQVPESAKPFLVPLRQAIIQAGAMPIVQYLPQGDQPGLFYQSLSMAQLQFFPDSYYKGLVKQIDHSLYIVADDDLKALADVDPARIIARSKALKPYHDWRQAKELKGKFTWTIALYGTEAMALEAGLSLEQYWEQIMEGCYLQQEDPIASWTQVNGQIAQYIQALNQLQIEQLHCLAPGTDLYLQMGQHRQFLGGGGRNIPSFEIFTSPDWRGTNGHIYFTEPLYYLGNLIKGIRLWFKDGEVVKATAESNQALLDQIVATKGANRVGEFSLTDGRHSKITHFMAETLFDENRGGPNGNMHLALGQSYHDTYSADPNLLKLQDWQRLGYNQSSLHLDIVTTAKRQVEAVLKNGQTKLIYVDGQFQL